MYIHNCSPFNVTLAKWFCAQLACSERHIKRNQTYIIVKKSTIYFQEQQIKIGKFNINYTKVGHGPHNVIMIPGALGTIRSHYQYQINGFNREKFSLVIFDPQGYGKSVPPERILTKKGYQRDANIAYELMKVHINLSYLIK